MRALAAFGRIDFQNIRRDSFLSYAILIPWMMLLLLRLVAPPLTNWLRSSFGFELEPYMFLVANLFFILQTPVAFGLVIGLLVLDERDDGTLLALRVTPLPLRIYALYRLLIAILLGALFVALLLPLSGFVDPTLTLRLIPTAMVAATLGPLSAAFLAAFARTKVEGLALMKGAGIFLLGPIAAWWLPLPWQWLAGILPTYWPSKAFWVVLEGGNPTLYLVVGALYSLVLTFVLLQRFQSKLYAA